MVRPPRSRLSYLQIAVGSSDVIEATRARTQALPEPFSCGAPAGILADGGLPIEARFSLEAEAGS
jgi:hypothetical protein